MYVHHLIVPDDLDGYFVISLQSISGSHHVAKDTMTCVPKHSVATIQLLSNTNTCTDEELGKKAV